MIYSCKVPECESGVDNRDIPYNQSWLRNAIPLKDGKLDMCSRYAPKNWITSQCSADMFDVTTEISCTEYIHASDERNLQTEVKNILLIKLGVLLINRIWRRFYALSFAIFSENSFQCNSILSQPKRPFRSFFTQYKAISIDLHLVH